MSISSSKFLSIIFWAAVAAALILSSPGCGGGSQVSDEAQVQEKAAAVDRKLEISRLNEKLISSADMTADRSDYVLGAGDLIEVKVFEAERLTTTARVSSRGFVTLPLLGTIKVKGLTAREAEKKIEELYYKEKYVRDPHVSVFIKEHFSQRITIVGQVKNPGTYDYPSRQTLLDVLALAGGLTEKAGKTITVRRMSGPEEQREKFIVDLERLITEGETQLNVEINGGDVVFVPEAGVYFVDGAVRKPGSYPLRRETAVREALLNAGGTESYADQDSVTLIRQVEDGSRKAFELDLDDPQDKEMKLKDRDILVVDKSAFGMLVHGFGIQLGVPGAGVSYKVPD